MTPKITFVGAGSVVFTQGLLADLFAYPELDGVHVALHDIDPDRLATALAAAQRIAAVRGVKPVLTAHADRREALSGADFVVNMVQIGMAAATRADSEVPQRYGLRQTIGDTPFDEVTYVAAGVNHQPWVLRFEHAGADLHPRLRELAESDGQLRRRVRFDMLRRLGCYPTETSEHSAEYVPWYRKHDTEIDRPRLPIGAYLDIVAENEAEYERTRRAIAAVEDDPRHIRHAAMADPATAATLPVERIFELCDDLVRAHGDRLQPALRAVLGR